MKELASYLPIAMVIAFLALTTLVGIYYSGKVTSLREYAVGNKRFSTPTLVATLLATAFGGGGLMRSVEQVHIQGLHYIILSIIISFTYAYLSPLALRMGPFMQHLSISETLGSIYGKYPRVITALSCILTSIASLAIQINVLSTAIGMCLGLGQEEIMSTTVAATLLLILYSSIGGIRAVTFTDVLQFITFSMIIPLLAWFMFQRIDKSIPEIVNLLQINKKFDYSSLLHWDKKMVSMVALILSFTLYEIDPASIQRLYMSSGPIQAQKVILYSGIFKFLIRVTILLIGIFTFASAPELERKEIWPYIVNHIPFYFKGLLCISLTAMAMSTADSKLNSSAVMLVHDIIGSKKVFFHITPLVMAKVSSLLIGILAMLLSIKCTDLFKLLKIAANCSVPIFTAPFILALFRFRGSSSTALFGMATGTIAILAWGWWIEPKTGIDGSFPCMVANGLAMMAAHYLLPKQKGVGWVAPDDEFKQLQQAHIRRKNRIKAEISTPLLLGGLLVIVINLILLIFTKSPIYLPLSFLFIGIGLAVYAIKLRQ